MGFVWSSKRNHLSVEKAKKLATIFRSLRPVDPELDLERSVDVVNREGDAVTLADEVKAEPMHFDEISDSSDSRLILYFVVFKLYFQLAVQN